MAQPSLISIFALIAALQSKHFICDGPLQTYAMVVSKSIYGQRDGIIHSALHGLGTFFVLLLFRYSAATIIVLAIADFVIHYHVDYTKENIVKRAGWTTQDAKFWWTLSADQMIHQFTYLGLAYAALITG